LAKVIVGMTISLDGFVADQNGNAGPLYPDLAALGHTAYMKDAIEQTGAVLMGRRTFEMGDPDSYIGNYEFQVPIFVLAHHPPSAAPQQDEQLTFTFVTDGVESAVAHAKAAARDKAVQVVGGVSIAQQLLDARLVGTSFRLISCRYFSAPVSGRLKTPALRASGWRKSACRKSAREPASDSA
jgi:dihydrofolate reductase